MMWIQVSNGVDFCRKHWKTISVASLLIAYLLIANYIGQRYKFRTGIKPPKIRSVIKGQFSKSVKFNNEKPCDVWINQKDIRRSLFRKSELLSKQHLTNLSLEYIEKNDDFTIKPSQIHFIRGSRNPCWMEGDRKRCLPSFFLAGFSKCGTTDLWCHLIRHKDILAEYDEKEPCWWGFRRIFSDQSSLKNSTEFKCRAEQKCKITMAQYLDNFHHKNRDFLIGDASTDNFWNIHYMSKFISYSTWSRPPSERLVEALNDFRIHQAFLIQRYIPKSKYILILRDPAERLFSAYKFSHYRNPQLKGVKPTVENFHNKVVFALALFHKCLVSTDDVRFCAYSTEIREQQKPFPVTIQKSLYVIFITDVLKLMDRKDMHFIHFDDYHKNRAAVLQKAFQFLGVDPDPELISQVKKEEKSEAANSSKDQHTDIGPMLDKTRAALRRFYRPFNQELARLLGDQRFLFE